MIDLRVTDLDWFDFLAAHPHDEVNFWRPSNTAVKALRPGDPVAFKLKSPRNKVGGFGIFERWTALPDWLAWDVFGTANGAPDRAAFQARMNAIRSRNRIDGPPTLGCIVLAQPVFLPKELWVAVPDSFSPRTVAGKRYDRTRGEGKALWEALLEAAMVARMWQADRVADGPGSDGADPDAERWGPDRTIRPRLGQAGFRLAVLDAYGRACAVTTEHSLPVLEAAHIQPYADGGRHDPSNGLLLRRDVHRLFDLGYVTVTPDHRFRVSDRLKREFDNGKVYYAFDGAPVRVPPGDAAPDRKALEWHGDVVFRG